MICNWLTGGRFKKCGQKVSATMQKEEPRESVPMVQHLPSSCRVPSSTMADSQSVTCVLRGEAYCARFLRFEMTLKQWFIIQRKLLTGVQLQDPCQLADSTGRKEAQ
eukprot:6218082-Amphidinium_carterae.2